MIRMEHFSVVLGGEPILHDLKIAIAAGEFVSIVGPNGAGKTTLLKSLMRILPSSGQINLDGKQLQTYRQRDLAKKISYVPQADGRMMGFSVFEFVMMGRYPHQTALSGRTPEDTRIVLEALEETRTARFRDHLVTNLSAGERQKVFIAAAIAQQAEVLLLDEPATFLDPSAEEEIYRILRNQNTTHKKTIVMVTHDVNRAALASTRILALKNGKILFDGTPEALMQPDMLRSLYDHLFELVDHPTASCRMIVPGVIS